MPFLHRLLTASILLVGTGLAYAQQHADDIPPADQPFQREYPARFAHLHQSFLDRAQEGPVDLLFLGDSITYHWRKAPHIWDHYYANYHPANFGIGGETTQSVLWRLTHGELDHIDPKVVVVMLGTNNTYYHTPDQIYAGLHQIISIIQEKLPEAKILLLGIFPRGPRTKDQPPLRTSEERMAIIRNVNARLADLDNGDSIRYLDISTKFLSAANTIPSIIMPDQLHPSAVGYQIWADAMDPLLTEMMTSPAHLSDQT